MPVFSIASGSFLVIGRAGMDLYADPPGASVETTEGFRTALGGSAANIAAGLVRLGCAADLVTCVSDDAVGRFVRGQLRTYGVGTQHVHTAGHPYRNSLAVTETRLEDCQNVIYRNGAADLALSPDHMAAVPFEGAGALVVTGTALSAEPSRSACIEAMGRAAAASVPVVFDVDFRPTAWPSRDEAHDVCSDAARHCGMIVANDEEFDVLAGRAGAGLALAEKLAAKEGKTCVYKMGEKGSVTFGAVSRVETPVFAIEALKPMGAGDAFMAGLLAGLAQGRSLAEALRRGSAAAAIVVSRFGCAPAMPTAGELDAFLRDRSGEAA